MALSVVEINPSSLKEVFEEKKIQDLEPTGGDAELELSLSLYQLEEE